MCHGMSLDLEVPVYSNPSSSHIRSCREWTLLALLPEPEPDGKPDYIKSVQRF